MNLILVTGGAQAGKSTFSVQLARHLGGDRDVCYLATAEPGDDEMRARIAAHRAARPAGWHTLEAPRGVGTALRGLTVPARPSVVLLDCLTMLVSNVLLAQADGADAVESAWPAVEAEINDLLQFAAQPAVTTIVVTNEVGLGIVPAHRLARVYRDLLGQANQRLASAAAFVYLVVSGIPLEIKGLADQVRSGCGTLAEASARDRLPSLTLRASVGWGRELSKGMQRPFAGQMGDRE